jgi:hypothetical protein
MPKNSFRIQEHKILAWDLKNEPNLDFENRDKDNVLNWLNHMVLSLKNLIPIILLLAGPTPMRLPD